MRRAGEDRRSWRRFGILMALLAAGLLAGCAAQKPKMVSTISINSVAIKERYFFGVVVDEQLKPLMGALIFIRDWKGTVACAVVTDAKGEFATDPLPPGQYYISVEAQGFSSVELKNVPISEDQSVKLNCSLVLNDSYRPLFAVPAMVDPKSTTTGAVISEGSNGQVYVDPK